MQWLFSDTYRQVVLPLVSGVFLVVWAPTLVVWLIFRCKHCALVHLTTEQAAAEIEASQELLAGACGIYALRESVLQRCETKVELFLATLVPWSRLAAIVKIPEPVVPLFRLFFPWGPYGMLKCLCGNYVAHFDRITFEPPKGIGSRLCILSVVADICMTGLAFTIASAYLYAFLSDRY